MPGKSRLRVVSRFFGSLSLILCLLVLGFWVAGLRTFHPTPLWLHVNGNQGREQFAIGSLDGQMELRRTARDEQPQPGPHCGERAACAAFEQKFPPRIRYEYLGCAIGREPVIDVVGSEEQLVKTGTAWFVIIPHGLAALLFGILPMLQILGRITPRTKRMRALETARIQPRRDGTTA